MATIMKKKSETPKDNSSDSTAKESSYSSSSASAGGGPEKSSTSGDIDIEYHQPCCSSSIRTHKNTETEYESSILRSSSSTMKMMVTTGDATNRTTKAYNNRNSAGVNNEFPVGSVAAASSSSEFSIITTNHHHNHRLDQQLTANKLRYQNVGLYGREDEVDLIKHCLRRLTNIQQQQQNELILVSGYSGTGKSKLIESTLRKCCCRKTAQQGGRENSIFFLQATAKFDLYNQGEPYSGFLDAIDELCRKIIERSSSVAIINNSSNTAVFNCDILERLRQQILEDIEESQIQQLLQILPHFQELLFGAKGTYAEASCYSKQEATIGQKEGGEAQQRRLDFDDDKHDNKTGTTTTILVGDASQNQRFNFLLRKLLNCITCCYDNPIVLVLNDLHWSDLQSLELLYLLITTAATATTSSSSPVVKCDTTSSSHTESDNNNTENNNIQSKNCIINNIMIVGSYRSNEVNETHLLSKTIRDLRVILQQQQDKTSSNFQLTEITIGNLDIDSTHHAIMDLLSMDDLSTRTQTTELAKTIHQRTHGNAFFVISFMRMLYENQLLKFNLSKWEWQWSIQEIEQSTSSTSNVVDILKNKMKTKLSREMRRFLQLAACLGCSQFEGSLIAIVWTNYDDDNHDDDTVSLPPTKGEEETIAEKDNKRSTMTNDVVQEEGAAMEEEEGQDVIEKGKENDCISVKSLLDEAVQESFLEIVGNTRYQWIHDKIQEAALAMVPQNEVEDMKFKVGVVLWKKIDPNELEEKYLFVVANLLSSKTQSSISKRNATSISASLNNDYDDDVMTKRQRERDLLQVEIAEINFRAARKAKTMYAFTSASTFAKVGIDHLPDDRWESHPQLTLALFSIGAQSEGIRGGTDVMEEYSSEVLKQSQCSIYDKLPVYHSKIDAYLSNGRNQEGSDICLDVLDQLNCRLPRGFTKQAFQAARIMLKMNSEKIASTEEIMALPMMTDPEKIESMGILRQLGTLAFKNHNPFLLILTLRRQMRWTMKFGLSEYSPVGYNGYGTLLNIFQNQNGAVQYAKNALLMLERLPCKTWESATLWPAYYFSLHWRQPLHSAIKPFWHGYQAGLRNGDTEAAMHNLLFIQYAYMLIGKPLPSICEDCSIFVPQMEELKRLDLAQQARLAWQAALNLMGESKNAKDLAGDVADTVKILQDARENKNFEFMNGLLEGVQMYLYTYVGEHELGANFALSKGDSLLKKFPGFAFGCGEAFCRGLSLYVMARKTKLRKYKKGAKYCQKLVKKWADDGNPNVKHHASLLQAEQAVLDGNMEVAREMYRSAVRLASRGGFIHDVAISNERYCTFALVEGDNEEAYYRLKEAIRSYTEWGSSLNVKRLQENYSDFLFPSEIVGGGSHYAATASSLNFGVSMDFSIQ